MASALGKERELGFCIEDVQLSLFRVGIGFLTIRARAKSNEIADWLDFIHYFRFLHRMRNGPVWARQRVGVNDAGQAVLKTYRPRLTEPTDGTDDGPFCFGEVLDGLLLQGAMDDDKGRWWSEVFVAGVTIPYAGLFVDRVSRTRSVSFCTNCTTVFIHAKETIRRQKTFASRSRI